jgi:hypothetical protein
MTTRRSVQVVAVTAVVLLAVATARPGIAHHSFAMYDMTATRTMTGTLARFIPGSNHAQLLFDLVRDDGTPMTENGKPVRWGVEMGSAAAISRNGITVANFPVGTILTVSLHPLRDGRPFGAIDGQLINCGVTMPAGGCTAATGKAFGAPAD